MIRKYLDCSTAHITRNDDSILTGDCRDWPYERVDQGYWVWVPNEPHLADNAHSFLDSGLSPFLWALILYARKNDCDWIKLDADGPRIHGLPEFDW